MTVHTKIAPPEQKPGRERRGLPFAPLVRIAHIVFVSGSRAIAFLDRSGDRADNTPHPRVQIGAIVRIATPSTVVIGQVSAVSAPLPDMDNTKNEIKIIEINLAGEIVTDSASKRLVFRRGVPNLPSLGDIVYLADRHDLTRLYNPPKVSSIKIGSVAEDTNVPARLLTDELLAKHFVVVGTTGAGKSCAVTCILQRLMEAHKAARIVILDIHGEYAATFGDAAEKLTVANFNLPLWMLNFQELIHALTSSENTKDEEIEILGEAILAAKRRYSEAAMGRAGQLVRKTAPEISALSVDTPAPFRISDVIAYIDEQLGMLERRRVTLSYRRLKARIELLVADKRYNFMFGSVTVQDTMTEVLSRLFRVPIDGKPVTVFDLATVPYEILDVVVSVVARLAFDLAVWSKGGLPMLIVAEEAHRYIPAQADRHFLPTRQALSRIAKEGRKFGISMALVTQRPSELDPTILSQCGTAISMRLVNDKDQNALRDGPYRGALDLFEFLPLLSDREAIVLGQGVSMPMRVRFDDLAQNGTPKSESRGFADKWNKEITNRSDLDAIVSRWRLYQREEG
jgi:uncharacterized protein